MRGYLVAFGAASMLLLGAATANATVYVETNTAPHNFVQTFHRAANGSLVAGPRYATGGVGNPGKNPPLGIPFLDTSNSVQLSPDGSLLFAVNAGDNTVSSFQVTDDGLVLADREPTLGERPVSVAVSGNGLLYVLNSTKGSASITGFRVSTGGELTPLEGSHRATSAPTKDLPASVNFDATGRVVVVADRGANKLDLFLLNERGVPRERVTRPSTGQGPYSVAFTDHDTMIVSNEHFPKVSKSSVSSYRLIVPEPESGGQLKLIPIGSVSAHAGGACWTVITPNESYVFVTAPFSHKIDAFRIGENGKLTPVTKSSHVAHPPGLTLDEGLSHNGGFLYVLDSAKFATDRVLSYRVNADGTLTLAGRSAPFQGSASGLAAW
jgi:6-phosphogluconolactonase